MVYLGCVVLILMVPVSRYFETMILRGAAPPSWLLLPIGVVGTLSVLVFISSTIVGLATIRRDY
jgi:hypothetical protein